MTNRAATILTAALLCAGTVYASNFEGKVVDFLTGKPAAGVEVVAKTSTDIKQEMSRATLRSRTNGQGNYTFKDALPGNEYVIRASAPGQVSTVVKAYAPQKGQIRVIRDPVRLVPEAPGSGAWLWEAGRARLLPAEHDGYLEPSPGDIPTVAVALGDTITVLQCVADDQQEGAVCQLKAEPGKAGKIRLSAPGRVEHAVSDYAQAPNPGCGRYSVTSFRLPLGPGPSVGYYAMWQFYDRRAATFRVASGPAEFLTAVRKGDAEKAARMVGATADAEADMKRKFEGYRGAVELWDTSSFREELGEKVAAIGKNQKGSEREQTIKELGWYWDDIRIERAFPSMLRSYSFVGKGFDDNSIIQTIEFGKDVGYGEKISIVTSNGKPFKVYEDKWILKESGYTTKNTCTERGKFYYIAGEVGTTITLSIYSNSR